MANEHYIQHQDGTVTLESSEPVTQVSSDTEGEIQLVAGKAIIQNANAGKNVVLSRKQSTSTFIGHLYIDIDETSPGVQFTIKSTNANDVGIVVWKIIE
jgi:hypothetical protein